MRIESPATPPTTPPAIAPACELDDDGDGVDIVELDEVEASAVELELEAGKLDVVADESDELEQ